MKEILEKLLENNYLSKEEAYNSMIDMTEGKANKALMSAFLTVFRMRKPCLEELSGFKDAMLDKCISPDLSDYNSIDLCGTGGDKKNTFNISTLSSFIVAGAEEKVIKHGNYSISSNCGSSNILEYFGYKFSNKEEILKKQLDKHGICYLHAPVFHPGMKNIAAVRKNLGIKTFFNMLGPMVNPGKPKNQMIGVYNNEISRLYNYLYQNMNINYSIVHSLDNYDEISLTDLSKIEASFGVFLMEAEEFGYRKIKPHEIIGGKDIKESAKTFIEILKGNGSYAQNAVVTVNSAIAIKTIHTEMSIEVCIEKAHKSLKSKNALNCFKNLILN